MTVAVVKIFDAQIYRDGGSRCFCFHSDDGNWYEFHVPVTRTDGVVSGHSEPTLYLESVNNQNAVHHFSWSEVQEFLLDLHFDKDRFRELVDVVSKRGKIST